MRWVRQRTRGWTLRRLTLFYVMLGIILTTVLDTAIYCTLSVKTLNEEIGRRHSLLTDSLASVIETAWRTDNFPLMVLLVDSMCAQGDIEQVVISDADHVVIISSDPVLTGKRLTPLDRYDHEVKISSLGTLHMTLASGQAEAFLQSLLWRGLLATGFALALLSILLHRPQRNLLKAFEGAVNAAEKLSLGDYSTLLPKHSIVEFNSLHTSINHAATQIQQLTTNLRQQVQHANAAIQAKDRFLANISHELRTPMNGVLGIAQLMETSQLPAEQKLHVETLRRCSESLLTVLNDLIDFARIDAGNEALRLSETPIVELIEDVIEMMAPQADSKGLELVFFSRIPGNQNLYFVDAARLRQIFYTVLAFSISQTQEGRIVVSLTIQPGHLAHTLTFSVNDTGHGMSSRELHKILDPFQQTESFKGITGGDKGGLNLGLALSRRLAMLMDGNLEAESQEGKGSVFNVTLKATASTTELDRRESGKKALLQGKKVLLVSAPQHLTGQSIKQSLLSLGCDVVEISPATEIDTQQFDRCLFIDDGAHPDEMERLCSELPSGKALLIRSRALCVTSASRSDKRGIVQLSRPVRTDTLIKSILALPGSDPVHDTGIAPGIVLVVEDIETNRMVIKKLLERDGWEVHIAEQGEQALALLDKGLRPQVVLMDLQMPVMDGFEATLEIRSRERRGLIPRQTIYAVTASTSREDADRCIQAGMNALIPKPFKMVEFRQILSHAQEMPAHSADCPVPEASAGLH